MKQKDQYKKCNYGGRIFFKSLLFIFCLIVGIFLGLVCSVKAYPEKFRTEIALENKSEIKPDESLVINFSQPVLEKYYEDKIKINRVDADFQKEESIKISWDDSGKLLNISPQNFWAPEAHYEIFLPEGKNMVFLAIDSKKMSFATVKYPKIVSVSPQNGAKNVSFDIEDPIVVNFDKSASGFFVKFDISPNNSLAYQNNSEKTQFKLLPQEKIQEGTDYYLNIFVKYAKAPDSDYSKVFSGSFTTEVTNVVWEKDFTLRLEQARKYTSPKINSGKYIDINLSTQILSTFEDGKLLGAYLVSSGKRGMGTPKGNHRIYNKATRVWSKEYGLYMPYWMAFMADGSRGIHELPEWPGGYKEGANHLGIPVSHGCVRLGVGPAKTVYNWADIGTPVIVY